MTAADLRTMRWRWIALSVAVSAVAVLLVTLYVGSLLQLSPAQWRTFGGFVGLAFLLCTAPYQWQGMRAFVPIGNSLGRPADDPAGREQDLAGLTAALRAPIRVAVAGVFWWALGGLIVVVGVGILHPELRGYGLAVTYTSTLSAASVAVMIHFLLAKRLLRSALTVLSARVPDPDRRERASATLRLATKLRVTVLVIVIGSIGFAAFLAQRRSGDPLEAVEAGHQLRFLEFVLEREGPDVTDQIDSLSREAVALGIARGIVLLDARAEVVLAGPPDLLEASELASIRSADTSSGDGFESYSPNVFAWTRISGGRGILVAATPWSDIAPSTQRLTLAFVLLTLASGSIGLALTQLLAGDAGFAIGRLRQWFRQVAGGDLRTTAALESEDEFGALGRDFDRMVADLRSLVEKVSRAVDGVEGTAADLGAVSVDVAHATSDQVAAIAETRGAVDTANGRIGAIAGSADELAAAIEESSAAILELNASDEELNAMASTLAGRTDEIAASVEQAAAGVQRIAETTEHLSGAAEETSSSMEEIARSMQAVRDYAEENASMSRQVAEAAERGRDRVLETAAGMEAIRGSAAAAQQVVQALDRRAAEIGRVLDVIESVADSTHLLALNAAIIASQSGESGRAFSVVAAEIKTLARRVLGSAQEIGELIGSLQSESRNALAAIEEGGQSVEHGVALSQEAGKSLSEITESARRSGQRAEDIVTAVREQTHAAGHVSEQMERVRAGVTEIRNASAEQHRGNEVLRAASRNMRDVAQRVHHTTAGQASGTGQIGRSLESIREGIAHIHGALREQSQAMASASISLAQVGGRTETHAETAAALGRATQDLLERAGALRESLSRFRV